MKHRSRRVGAALIMVLWAIAILSLVAGGLSFAIRQDLAIANIERDRMVAHWLARAGVERTIAAIMDDVDSTDTTIESWYDNPSDMEDVKLTGGTFSVAHGSDDDVPMVLYGAEDEGGKLNINVATREQLLKLPDMTEPIAGAIIDWRDKDEEANEDGVERGYYGSLNHPYDIRNEAFRTVRELLLVRGVTPDLFYGEDHNANGLLDADENDGDATGPPDNADGRLDRGWIAYVTVYSFAKNVNGWGQQRLNLAKASEPQLMLRLHLESWAAKSIIKARENKKEGHLVDLLDVKRDPSIRRGATEDDYYPRSDGEKDQPVTKYIFQQIVDDLTLKDDEILYGQINLNTASRVVLGALPGVTEELAEAIAQRRDALGQFSSIGQLLDVNGLTKEVFGQLEDSVTVRSSVFRMRSEGQSASGLAKATIECVMDRADEAPRILYWLESSP